MPNKVLLVFIHYFCIKVLNYLVLNIKKEVKDLE